MTAIAEELDRRLQTLDPQRAARCEQVVRDLLALLEEETKPEQAAPPKFITRTHDFGFKPGIDLTKLGQLADDL